MTVVLCKHNLNPADCHDCGRLLRIKEAAEAHKAKGSGKSQAANGAPAAPTNRLEVAAALRAVVQNLGPESSISEAIAAAATRGLKVKAGNVYTARRSLGFGGPASSPRNGGGQRASQVSREAFGRLGGRQAQGAQADRHE